jgi:hypothetical protein
VVERRAVSPAIRRFMARLTDKIKRALYRPEPGATSDHDAGAGPEPAGTPERGAELEEHRIPPPRSPSKTGTPSGILPALLPFLTALGIAGLVAATGGAILWVRYWQAELPAFNAVSATPKPDLIVLGAVALGGFGLIGLLGVLGVYLLDRWGTVSEQNKFGLIVLLVVGVVAAVWLAHPSALGGIAATVFIVAFGTVAAFVSWRFGRGEPIQVPAGLRSVERPRVTRRRLPWSAIVFEMLLGAAACAVLYFVDWWVAVATGVGILLAWGALGVAGATGERFRWYGLSVFCAVLVFGAVVSALRTWHAPKLQTAAWIFKSEAGGRPFAGVLIAEGSDRVYVGQVERRCRLDNNLRLVPTVEALRGSGHILSLSRSDLAALSIGPLEGLPTATERANQLMRDLERRQAAAPTETERSPQGKAALAGDATAQPAASPGPCAGQGEEDLAARAATHPPPEQALRLARRFRPIILFDGGERWRPLRVEALFAERFGGGEGHRLCQTAPRARETCIRIRSARTLTRAAQGSPGGGARTHLDLHGDSHGGEDVGAPTLASCLELSPTLEGRLDCGAGPESAIYYNVTSANGRFYVDYWWFLRYNRFDRVSDELNACRGGVRPCFDHEGDWEGITAVTAPDRPRDMEYVGYAEHDGVYRYTASEVRVGTRPVVYVAKGSHASYPHKCTTGCRQVVRVFGYRLPEGRADGQAAWGRNRDELCFRGSRCLRPLPDPAGGRDWNAYDGRWGSRVCRRARGGPCRLAAGPRSPSAQRRFQYPWCFALGAGGKISCDAPAPGADQDAGPGQATRTDCRAWFGPAVAAVACDPATVAAALDPTRAVPETEFLIRAGSLVDSTRDNPGVAQLVRAPFQVGERVQIAHKAPPGTLVSVRALDGGRLFEATVAMLGLGADGEVTLRLQRRGQGLALEITRPKGRPQIVTMRPVKSSRPPK